MGGQDERQGMEGWNERRRRRRRRGEGEQGGSQEQLGKMGGMKRVPRLPENAASGVNNRPKTTLFRQHKFSD